ncbi:MAG: lamin tail domain-containing protein [Ardenticatenaceae bacterium]|nr:lamin tail domain-containing protein [Ardenticatenaceae bacterium]MCB8948849.1 lamin tail domain-containing protein [Ardenticatenaceae bacterium]
MLRQKMTVLFLIFMFSGWLLTACESEEIPTETPVPATATAVPNPDPTATSEPGDAPAIQTEGVFFSELLTGVPGGNSQEFIELYNAGSEPVDLMGWSIFYLLGEGQEQSLVYRWTETAVIPPQGHILLVHEGQDVGADPDGFFTQSLFERRGGLLLRNKTQQTVDLLGWGDAPAEFTAGEPVAASDGGASLERLPGGEAGNAQNSGSNATDFAALATPNPQNSGSPITPQPDEFLTIDVSAPEAIAPGSEFVLTVEVGNESETAVANVTISLPVASYFELVVAPEGAELANGRLTWIMPEVAANGSQTAEITLLSPFTYTDTLLTGYYADADGYLAAFGQPRLISMAGGAIPIATARELVGSVVSVEGIATMYTGGFFAGSGGKFYMQDETGGIQVYIPGDQAQATVAIGDRVRVTGLIEPYRDSLELIPGDVEILGEEEVPGPLAVTVEDVNNSDAILGELVAIEGTVLAVEDFSFDFQVQIDQGTGETATVLIEKQTGASAELIEVGQNYRMVGISEFYQGVRQVKPRLQSDIVEIIPPIVLLEMQTNNTAVPGEVLTYTVTAANYTAEPLTNVFVELEVPGGVANALQVQPDQNGISANGDVIWSVDELAANGGTAVLQYFFTVPDNQTEPLMALPAQLTADAQAEPVLSNSFTTFLGDAVPIWAIQGEGDRSPYVSIEAATSGVVTAVFPELNGFFIQDLAPDDNPATSDGLFVFTGVLPITVQVGDLLEVNGRVRELSGQTALQVEALADVVVNSSGYTNIFEPVPYDPPQDPAAALVYNEALEGVLVGLIDPALVIAPTTQYGEYALLYEKWGVTSVARTDDSGFLIYVDDGSSTVHDDQDSLPYAVAKGDFVANLVGPLAYTFGNYKIEPIAVPDVAAMNRPLPIIRAANENELSIATFNVENLFDLVTPHPSSPPIPTVFEYRNKLEKIAQTIVAMGAPTIIGLQEVENLDILQDLVEEEAIAEFGYEPFLIEGNDSRGIDVGYLVRSDRATVESVAAYDAPGELFARPPLVITVTAHLSSGDQTVIVLNNHFLSLSAGEEVTEPVRAAQAAWNTAIIEELAAENPEAQFVVLGDLNSFFETLPLDILEASGLQHVYWYLGEEERPYTYIFEGRTQTLDHIVVSPELFARLALVQPLHTNADYPVPDPEDTSPRRVSDHDPLVAIFSFPE